MTKRKAHRVPAADRLDVPAPTAECRMDLDEATGRIACPVHPTCNALDGPCLAPGCPHCGPGPRVNGPLMIRRVAAAQRRLEAWEVKLSRAAAAVVAARKEVRRLWKRLEAAGEFRHPMEISDAPEAGDVEEGGDG
jgi:hypothetical protein